MTTNPSPDAVEALIKILNEARCNSPRTVGNRELAQRIIDAGFTIAPIGVAKQPEAQSVPALTRQPASAALVAPMTDAELERKMEAAIYECEPERNQVKAAMEVAKKYRG